MSLSTFFHIDQGTYVRMDEHFGSRAFLEHVWAQDVSPLRPEELSGHTFDSEIRRNPATRELEFPLVKRTRGGSYLRTGDWLPWLELHRRNPIAVKPPPIDPQTITPIASSSTQVAAAHRREAKAKPDATAFAAPSLLSRLSPMHVRAPTTEEPKPSPSRGNQRRHASSGKRREGSEAAVPFPSTSESAPATPAEASSPTQGGKKHLPPQTKGGPGTIAVLGEDGWWYSAAAPIEGGTATTPTTTTGSAASPAPAPTSKSAVKSAPAGFGTSSSRWATAAPPAARTPSPQPPATGANATTVAKSHPRQNALAIRKPPSAGSSNGSDAATNASSGRSTTTSLTSNSSTTPSLVLDKPDEQLAMVAPPSPAMAQVEALLATMRVDTAAAKSSPSSPVLPSTPLKPVVEAIAPPPPPPVTLPVHPRRDWADEDDDDFDLPDWADLTPRRQSLSPVIPRSPVEPAPRPVEPAIAAKGRAPQLTKQNAAPTAKSGAASSSADHRTPNRRMRGRGQGAGAGAAPSPNSVFSRLAGGLVVKPSQQQQPPSGTDNVPNRAAEGERVSRRR